MTEVSVTARRRAPRPPRPRGVMIGSVGLFVLLVAVLAWQMRAGHDPSLSAVRAVAQRRGIVRRVEHVVVVSRIIEDDGGQNGQGAAPGGSGAQLPSSATQVAQAPALAAPSAAVPVSRTSGAP